MTRSVEQPLHLVQTADEGVMISVTAVMVGEKPTLALENPCNISLQVGADYAWYDRLITQSVTSITFAGFARRRG